MKQGTATPEPENTNDSWNGARVWSRFQPRWHIHVKRRPCPARSRLPKRGLIIPILVGPADKIAETAKSAGIDLGNLEIIDVPHSHRGGREGR